MKNLLIISSFLFAFLLLLPLTALNGTVSVPASAAVSVPDRRIPDAKTAASDSFRLMDTSTGEITELSAEDYILGVVSAEMPALYDSEALKAQAVAAYTYACFRRAENSGRDYDITNDHTSDQSFISPEKSKERWGDKADEYTEKLLAAVRETEGCMITLDGCPIVSVYHAVSSGKTESSKNVWGSDYSYLSPVDSICDRLSPDYLSNVSVTPDQLSAELSDISFTGDASGWLTDVKTSDSGTVLSVTVCGEKLTGARLRSALGLRSSCYEVKYSGSSFDFTVRGYGHGVGMSQYGANYMAKQGSKFDEILMHYYTGCKVEKIKK